MSYEALLAEQAEHRRAFGWMLIRWRAANDWTLYDPARLGETKGFRLVPYGMWQQLEQGRAGELQSSTFMALGELNRHAPVPIGDWTPMEFWACYCGLLPVPARWRQP